MERERRTQGNMLRDKLKIELANHNIHRISRDDFITYNRANHICERI